MFRDTQEVRNCCGGVSYRFIYDHAEFSTWFTHVDEHGIRERYWSRIVPGDVVLDVGAASGSYVLPALARGAAHVYAVDPRQNGVADPSIDILLASLDANGWRGRCSILPFGLWSQRGWLVVHDGPPPSDFYPPETFPVPDRAMPVTALDQADVLHGLERLDWVKIDVEGAEVEVLRGGAATLRRFRPRILVEAHLFKNADMENRIAAVLEPLGYTVAGRMPNACVVHTLWEPTEALA